MKLPESLENFIVDDMTPRQVQHVEPVLASKASGAVAEIYAQIRQDFQLVPPLTMLSPEPDLLAAVWSIWRECQFAVGTVERPVTEAIAASISQMNECSYCVDAHSGMLHASSDHDVVDGIIRNNGDAIRNAGMRSIVEWAVATRTPGSDILRTPPFTPKEAPEIIGTAVTYHFVNRMVTIFLPATPMPVPGNREGLRRMAARIFGATVGKSIVARKPVPGESLRFVPESILPDDLSWASENFHVANAFAGCATLIERVGEKALPAVVRDSLSEALQSWQGESMGLSRSWLEEALRNIDDRHKPAARLAYLGAFAPHQLDDHIIRAFRETRPGDDGLLGATAWASFAAARRIGRWLGGG